MDYSTEEVAVLSLFDGYLAAGQYLEAERFLEDEMQSKPQATMLRFHYAKYLKEQKQNAEEAIRLLEEILELGNDHPYVLRLLLSSYMSVELPEYERAHIYVQQLESLLLEDEDLRLQVGKFYIRWSIQIKMNRDINPDPIDEMLRQQKYKELAQKGLDTLKRIKGRTHEIYYFLAQGYFNLWDYENASSMITKAIRLCDEDPRYYHSYTYLRDLILKQQAKYSASREEYLD
jgi:tetratricopeptide (TPR) repeat protein